MAATVKRGSSSLAEADAASQAMERLRRIAPDSQRRWGRMTAHQMICHLSDSFRGALGERSARPVDNAMTRTVMRWVALHLPMQWPKGRIRTLREADQERDGTPPEDFARDLQALEALIERFAALGGELEGRHHPIFGPLTREEWGVWGYRHIDHHLRQFGL